MVVKEEEALFVLLPSAEEEGGEWREEAQEKKRQGEMEKMGQEQGQTKQEAQMGPCRLGEA